MIDIIATLGRVGVPAADATSIAAGIVDGTASPLAEVDYLTLRYDRAAHEADLDRRLCEATERVIPRRRGRPPKR